MIRGIIMKLGFEFETKYIEFELIYRKRKTMEIKVEESGGVKVIAPTGIDENYILKLVQSKAKWIIEKRNQIAIINNNKVKRKIANGEPYMYLGQDYILKLVENNNIKEIKTKLLNENILVTTNTKDEGKIKLALEKWYREKTFEKVNERIQYYERYFKYKVRNVRVKEQKRRWASCTYNNDLLFNWRCIMAPIDVLDYIVIHEMCHMEHKNHSKEFWDEVKRILPNYNLNKQWLKTNGINMDL